MGNPLEKLLENLKHPVDGVRHRTRVELSERDTNEVIKATPGVDEAIQSLRKKRMLIILWKHYGFTNSITAEMEDCFNDMLKSPHPHARMAALTVQHHWYNADPAKGHRCRGRRSSKCTKNRVLFRIPII
jgi:hypothetical protein